MSESIFVILKSITLSEISATNLGDISIKSKVESNLFIVVTTNLIPLIYENSRYVVPPSISLLNESGEVKSVTKLVFPTTDSEPNFQPYCGIKDTYAPLFHI